jgi:guanosine-diphosphatase
MFGSRKYTPLPTSANQQRRRAGGGLTAWKRWALIGATVSIFILLGVSVASRHKIAEEYWPAETYTPDLDKMPGQDVDETDYSTPPFRPPSVAVGSPDDENDVQDDEVMRIKPIGDLSSHVHDDPEDDELLEYPSTESSPHDPTADAAKGAHEADPDFSDIDEEMDEGEEGKAAEAKLGGLPTSFETDSNPSGSTACTKSHSTTRPIVQYALTIDAGSTGSRIHVYKFNNCGPSPALEYETFLSINPGLSAYPRDPTAAAASLDPLLKEAERVVPKSMWNCSPVEVKATAGLRLLGTDQSQAILDEVRNRLETNYKFVVASEGSVEIMEGKDEGVYAWITANYLLNKIGEGATSKDTLAVMDLGGASTQIVFEPRFPAASGQLAEGEHKYLLKFGGKEFTLYQHSYLGYGLMRARRSVHNLVAHLWSFGRGEVDWDQLDEKVVVPNPCLTLGSTRRVELDPQGRKAVNVTMQGGNGKFEACSKFVELVMAKDA